jgi:hypothetical protein
VPIPRRPAAVAAGLLTAAAVVLGSLTGCSGGGGDASAPTLREVSALLARHGAAVRADDRPAFLADVDPDRSAARFRTAQAAQFANLSRLPLSRWAYRVDTRTEDHAAERAAGRKLHAAAVVVRITLSYALRRADPAPSEHSLWWTFVRRHGRVVVAGDDALAGAGGAGWRGPWDFGPLTVVDGTRSLVMGHDPAATLRPLATAVDAAVPAVSKVWREPWTRYVAVVVPGSAAELDAAVGEASSLTTGVAAAAVSDPADPVTGAVTGQRLIVNPAALARLTDVGRQIVLRHEVTHMAAVRSTTAATPPWLAEGFAEYVGNLDSGQPPGVAAAELRADVRAGRAPRQLPRPADFDTGGAAAQAYQEAWLACRLIAARVGTPGLVRFYRTVGADVTDVDGAVAAALRTVLHETPAAFTAQWRAYVRRELG